MFVEGIIDRGVLEAMRMAGFDVMWVADTPGKAKRKGYEWDRADFKAEVIARIYLEEDMEDVFPSEKIVECVRTRDLPLLIGNSNPDIVEAVKERLKGKSRTYSASKRPHILKLRLSRRLSLSLNGQSVAGHAKQVKMESTGTMLEQSIL